MMEMMSWMMNPALIHKEVSNPLEISIIAMKTTATGVVVVKDQPILIVALQDIQIMEEMAEEVVIVSCTAHAKMVDKVDVLTTIMIIGTGDTLYQQLCIHGIILLA